MKHLKFLQIVGLAIFTMLFSLTANSQAFVNNWARIAGSTPHSWSGTYTGGTVTVTQTGTGSNITNTSAVSVNLNGATGSEIFATQGPTSGTSKSLTFTFSTPVIINELSINDIDKTTTWHDAFTFSGVTFTSVTGASVSRNVTSATGTVEVGPGAEWARWSTSTTPISSFTIDFSTIGGLTHAILCYAMKVTAVASCTAGTAAPTLSATTKANVCPSTTVDLTTITASNTPAGTTLTWHTGTPATTANKVTGTAVAAGTYYAAFFDATNDCYSGTAGDGTTEVTATVSACTTPVTVGTPATITGSTGTTVTGNPPTGVTGGTSPYTYADGTGDALCTAPTSPTLALPAGRIVSLVGSTGAHNINTVGLGAGTYEYCIKVCDASGTNCTVSNHTIVVTAACNAGSAAPALIKN